MKKLLLSFILLISILSINAQNNTNYNTYNRYDNHLIKRHNKPRLNILPIIASAITGAIIANQINESAYYDNQRDIIRYRYLQSQLELQRLQLIESQLELLEIENRRPRRTFGIFNRRNNIY
jgi:hypothetical protein